MKQLLALLLVIGICSASITILSPRDGSVRYVGDVIQIIGNIESNKDCSGPVSILLDNKTLEQVDHLFTAGSTVTLDSLFTKRSFAAEKGVHVVRLTSQCFDDASTSIIVTDVLDINYEVNKNQLLLDEPILITAYAVKSDRVNGVTKIKINGNEYTDSASYSFAVPGNFTISIEAKDGYGNHGSLSINVSVLDYLSVAASPDMTLYKPSDKIWLDINVTDGFGKTRTANVSISLPGVNGTYELTGHGAVNFNLPSDSKPGLMIISVEASVGRNKGGKAIEVKIDRVPTYFDMSINNNYLRGEAASIVLSVRDQVNESIEDELFPLVISDSSGTIVAKAQVGTEQPYSLDTANLNPGAYSAMVYYDGQEYNKNFTISPASISQTPSPLTGLAIGDTSTLSLAVGLLALIIGAARYLQGKRIESKL